MPGFARVARSPGIWKLPLFFGDALMVVLGYILLAMVSLYAVVGLAVGLRFSSVLAAQSDERAAVGTFFFRLLLIPGAALLWPLIVRLGGAGFPKTLPHPCQAPAVPDALPPGSHS